MVALTTCLAIAKQLQYGEACIMLLCLASTKHPLKYGPYGEKGIHKRPTIGTDQPTSVPRAIPF